jgi:hypothetical protein
VVQADPVGIVSDNFSNQVNIFNADLDVVTTMLDARPGMAVGDCAVVSDESTGFSTSSGHEVTVLDLANMHADSAGLVRQVAISNLGVDMALSPDDAFLVLAGGGSLQQPLSIVDTRQGMEVATSAPFVDHTSVEFCDNGTMLVTTTHGRYYGHELDNAVYDFAIDANGRTEAGGHRLSSGAQPNNALCAPGSLTGILLDREGGLTSFTLPDLEPLDYHLLDTSAGIAAVFGHGGRELFVRTRSAVEAFRFNPVSGDLRHAWRHALPASSNFYGIEQIAIHPAGNKLYVDGGGPVVILDPLTGKELGNIQMGDATGICFANNPGMPLQSTLALSEDAVSAP